MWCIVNLPNGTQQAVECDSKAIGQECLEKVCKALNMFCEMEYFGLEHWSPTEKESRTRQWINLRNRLSQDSGSGNGIQLMLALRVKFWVPIHLILQESVRNIFYMQAKMDLLDGRLNAKDWDSAARMAALLCQADGIKFNQESLTAKCPVRIKQELKEKKDKEHVSAFKKRRLSKQKSVDSIDIAATIAANGCSTTHHHQSFEGTSSSHIDIELSPLQIYEDYIIRPSESERIEMPVEFLRRIAEEHAKLSKLKIASKSAKYWLLKEMQELSGFGEETFSGVTATEQSVRCDLCVGPHGLCVITGDDKKYIPFSAIATAKSFRRTFKLEYVDDTNERRELDIKLPKHAIAAGLYRSITERHAFYVCDKVRVVVTAQFTRDFKGTIASMFKEDTELGKRYVFDIQRTCREVHDQARRILHERGVEVTGSSADIERYLPLLELVDGKGMDAAIKEKQNKEKSIECCVDNRINEAMTCKICMDKEINTMFNTCGHVTACNSCAMKCDRCPNCREKVTSVVKIFLPPELRTTHLPVTV